MTISPRITICCAIVIVALASNANGQIIDFEPDGNGQFPDTSLAVDGIDFAGQYSPSPFNVSFFIDTDGSLVDDENTYPTLEGRGISTNFSPDGFTCDACGIALDPNDPFNSSPLDVPHPSATSDIDDFFLRHVFTSTVSENIVIEYAFPVQQASGEIWDIDASGSQNAQSERFLVEALNASGTVIDSSLSPKGLHPNDTASLNGKPWMFQLDVTSQTSQSISFLRISVPAGFRLNSGFALDNFSPAGIPEPSSVALACMGLVGMVATRRRLT